MEHGNDGDTNRSRSPWNGHKNLEKTMWIGDKEKNRDHPAKIS